MEEYYVYILFSEHKDTYYKGITNNVIRRLSEHNEGKSRYTKSAGDWVVVWSKKFTNKTEALIEERRIKKLNRRSLEKIIKS